MIGWLARLDPVDRRRWAKRSLAIAALALFAAIPVAREASAPHSRRAARGADLQLIAWNVGQGQWATLSRPDECWHFDMGGERADWRAIAAECARKRNRVSFSHWDLDHISFARAAARLLPGLCVAHRPLGPAPGARKRRLLEALPDCADEGPARVRELTGAPASAKRPRLDARPPRLAAGPTAPRRPGANELSRVFLAEERALIPGDSPKSQETLWSRALTRSSRPSILILGHHGSRTSTGAQLLARLPRLRLAIASGRRSRYGHPHPEVARRLKEKGVALVRTEIWGHVRMALAPDREAERAPP